MLFAPSTIAIAALILSFSILLMDCTLWLNTIPNFCLPLLEENPSESWNTNFDDYNHPNVLKSKCLKSSYRLDNNNNTKESISNQFERIHDKIDQTPHDCTNDKTDTSNSQHLPSGQRHRHFQNNQNNQNGQYNENQQNQSHQIKRIELRNKNKFHSLEHLSNRKLNPSHAKQNRNNRFFDIDSCLNCFKFVESKYSPCKINKNSTNSSPVSIVALPELETNDRKVTFSYEHLDFSTHACVDNLKNIELHEKKGKNKTDMKNNIDGEIGLKEYDVSRNFIDEVSNHNFQVNGGGNVDNCSNDDNINKSSKNNRKKQSDNKKRSVSSNSLIPIESSNHQISVCLASDLDCPIRSVKTNSFSNHFSKGNDIDNRLRKRILFDDIDCSSVHDENE